MKSSGHRRGIFLYMSIFVLSRRLFVKSCYISLKCDLSISERNLSAQNATYISPNATWPMNGCVGKLFYLW